MTDDSFYRCPASGPDLLYVDNNIPNVYTIQEKLCDYKLIQESKLYTVISNNKAISHWEGHIDMGLNPPGNANPCLITKHPT